MTILAGKSFLVLPRSLMPRFGKVLIAAATAATVRNQYALARRGEIGDGRAALIVEHQCAEWNLQDHVLTGMAGAVGAFAVAAAVGLEFAIVAVTEHPLVIRIALQQHAASITPAT